MSLSDLELVENRTMRVAYCEHDFRWWFLYHFGFKLKKFHSDWIDSMQSRQNTFIEAFRASRKTTIARAFVVWCICYKKEPSIIVQSYEDTLSAERVREVAKMLCKKSIVSDYGVLFPFDTKKEELAKKSMNNFETTNGVKIASKSLGQTLRGSNTYDIEDEMSARPTLLILDDIDVSKSVSNIEIIQQNEKKILGETISALDPLRRKIIFLGNTINEDGIVPRFRNNYKDSPNWDIFHQPLVKDNINQRPEVFTQEVIETLQEDGKMSRNMNYLLVASTTGSGAFIKSYFDYFLESHFEDIDTGLKRSDVERGIYVDPAFSTDSRSDDACVVGGGRHKLTKAFYLWDGYAGTSAPSVTYAEIAGMYRRMDMRGVKPQYIKVEDVKISKKQTDFIKGLKIYLLEQEIYCPVISIFDFQNKNDRIKYSLEPLMSMQGLKTNKGLQSSFVSKMENQFLEFPHGNHDDIIDTIAHMVISFKTAGNNTLDQRTKKEVVHDPVIYNMKKNRGSNFSNQSTSHGSMI